LSATIWSTVVDTACAQPSREQAWSALSQDIRLAANTGKRWFEGEIEFILLEGDVLIEQGLHRCRANTTLAWRDRADNELIRKLSFLAEGNVRMESPGSPERTTESLYQVLETKAQVVLTRPTLDAAPQSDHPLRQRAAELLKERSATPVDSSVVPAVGGPRDDTGIRQMQGVQPLPTPDDPGPLSNEIRPTPSIRQPSATFGPSLGTGSARRIRGFPRTSQPFNFNSSLSPDGQYRQWLFSGGINLVVEEVATGNTVDIVADRAVLWTRGDLAGDPMGGGLQTDASQEVEIYLEGNVYIRQGNPSRPADTMGVVLSGKQVYFNVNSNQALVVDGTVEALEPRLQVPVYMSAPEIRQLAPGEFFGRDASFTTSVHRGTPGYALRGKEIYFEEIRERLKNPFTGQEVIDTNTNQPVEITRHFATGYANTLRVNDFPVFFWPYVRANAEDPLGPIENIRVGQSQNLGVFGSVSLDVWQLLGLDYLPVADNTNWLVDLGYFSDRGFAGGSRFNYFGQSLLSPTDTYYGDILGWYLNDGGFDQLGPTRRGLVPSTNDRGRFRLQHRYDLNEDTTLIAEVSYLTDSNVLESFFENEYDTGKDQETLVYGKYGRDNWAITGLVQPRLRDFLPQNEFLPRLDGYWIGQPFFDDRFTYTTHTSLLFGNLNVPSNFVLPGEEEFSLGRVDTRHEIDLPLDFADWQVTPFAIGDFAGYTDAPAADGIGRLYGALGVRTSLPFYRIYPGVKSDLFYLNGLAHKVAFNVDYIYARSSHRFGELPLIDQLDDDTSELVRRQNILRAFGGAAPAFYDPRFQALRRNILFYPEALDNQHNVRVSLVNRLETKRGPIQQLRTIEWMFLDTGVTLFPEADRDNLGDFYGLLDYTYRWNLGDRTAIQSEGLYEPFDDTLQLGGQLSVQRPPRTLLSLIYSHYSSGPFLSNYIGTGISYRFSNRYAGFFEIGKDLEAPDAVNVRASFSRVGLDFVTTLGVNWNAGRDDFGVDFSILPRVGIRSSYGRRGLQTLPFGVEPAGQITPATLDRQAILNSTTY
jgi:hypothetical protein